MSQKLLLVFACVLSALLINANALAAEEYEIWISYDVNYVDARNKVNENLSKEIDAVNKSMKDSLSSGSEVLPISVPWPCDFVLIEYEALNINEYSESTKYEKKRSQLDVTVPLGEFCSFHHFIFDTSRKALMVLKKKNNKYVLHDYEEIKLDKSGKWYISSEEFIDKFGLNKIRKKINSSDNCRETFEITKKILKREGIEDIVYINESFVCPETGVYIEDIKNYLR